MLRPKDIYTRCDELDGLPVLHRENYLFELELLRTKLAHGASVLQVGSMDGQRILRLHQIRPDLTLCGLDIDPELTELARVQAQEADVAASFVTGDITDPPELPSFDYVICLNNTLGYINDEDQAIAQMRRLSKAVILSVYGERFDDKLAASYFTTLGLSIIHSNRDSVLVSEIGVVKRYDHSTIRAIAHDIKRTPIGYFFTLAPESV